MFLTKEKPSGIIFLQRDKLYLYIDGMPNFVELRFLGNEVRDLEIIDERILISQIHSLIEKNNISPASLYIVLDDSVYFKKELPENQAYDHNNLAIQSFLDNVPFESISYKLFSIAKRVKIIATNQQFYELIKNAFESKKFSIAAILPVFLFEKNISLQNGVTQEIFKTILQTIDLYKNLTLPLTRIKKVEKHEEKKRQEKKSGSRLIFLISIFFLLVGVLIFIFLKSSSDNQKRLKPATITPRKTTRPTVAVGKPDKTSHKQSTMASPMNKTQEDLKIQILNRGLLSNWYETPPPIGH